jgi:hypothetical protein
MSVLQRTSVAAGLRATDNRATDTATFPEYSTCTFFFDIDRSLLIIERGTCCEARACSKCRVVPRHDARCPLGLGRRKKSGDGGGEREEDVSKQNYQVKLNKVNICHETGNLCI